MYKTIQESTQIIHKIMESPNLKHISQCFIKPHTTPKESNKPFYMAPFDFAMLSAHYIQKGLLFTKPPQAKSNPNFLPTLLTKLKHTLSLALVSFYPLAGRLVTEKRQDPHLYLVYVDCSNSPGVKFIHASLPMSISDILAPTDVPLVVQSFFDHDRAVNHDGHTTSLLTAQVTELTDGVFIGLSMNHALGDGTSFWHFFNTWSEIYRRLEETDDVSDEISISIISRPPVLERWFPDGHGPIIGLPYANPNEFIKRYEAPKLRERMFHFSSETLNKLKSMANSQCGTSKISSFRSLSALMWRCLTRARGFDPEQEVSCRLAANNRGRIKPPLSPNYFGNCIHPVKSPPVKAGELLSNSFGWAAQRLHETVANHNDEWIRRAVDTWMRSPVVYNLGVTFDEHSIMMGSGPRFDMYGNEFGMGIAVALRSGYANKFSGKVSSYPGREEGSVDLEVCLPPLAMKALECDEEFLEAASVLRYD